MSKRFFSTLIDLSILLIFSLLFWAVLGSASGTIFNNTHFTDDTVAANNFKLIFSIFILFAFIYHAVIAIRGLSFGKRLMGITTESQTVSKKRLIIKELALKWALFYTLPVLLMFINFKIGVLILLALILCYFVASLILWRKRRATLIDAISGIKLTTKDDEALSTRNMHRLSVSALFIDMSIIFCLTTVANTLISELYHVEYFNIFFVTVLIYHALTIFTQGSTIGKLMLGLRITKEDFALKTIDIIKREILFKYITFFAIPYVILRIIGIIDPYCQFLNIITIVGFIAIIYFSHYGEMWWTSLAGTRKSVEKKSILSTTLLFATILIICIGSFLFVQTENNEFQESKMKFLGFEYPFKFKTAKNLDVTEYTSFLSKQNSSPKEYILNLFEKYDIVILCENFHGEATQWDLIFDIVSDKRFIENVGAVFTEYGSAAHQDKVDRFLFTHYESDTLREREAASIMWYMSGGFYSFLVNLNKLNSTLDDSLKVREYFTDMIDWDYFVTGSRRDIPLIEKRDSLMAQVTIDWYNHAVESGSRNKCLVVTNYRHAFGYPNGVEKIKDNPKFLNLTSGCQGHYIFEAIPGRVANVMQLAPRKTQKFFFPFLFNELIQNGKWQKAFEEIGNQPLGFDLKGSPFGTDGFDMYPLRGGKLIHTYQDFFTGLIFHKPYEQLISTDYPYQRYAMEQEYFQKEEQLNPTQLDYIRKYFRDEAMEPDTERWKMSVSRINFVELLSLTIFAALGVIFGLFHYLRTVLNNRQSAK